MYEEGNKNLSLNWKSLIIKLVIVAVIILLIGFIIAKVTGNKDNKNTLLATNEKEYISNIATMKNAAFEYYTTSKLPEKVGQTEKLTLTQMLNQKLLIDFTNDGKTCDNDNSYVQVTKTADGNYALKVSLTCGKQSDFIVTTIENKNITSNGNINPSTIPTNTDTNSSNNNSSSSTNNNKATTTTTNNNRPSSSSSSNKTTTTTVKTTVSVKVNCSTPCCANNCTMGDNTNNNNNNNNNPKPVEKIREYKLSRKSGWESGYSFDQNAENKKETLKTYDYCKENSQTYYTTSYIYADAKAHTYSYELQFLDIKPSKVLDSSIEISNRSYYTSSLTNYSSYISQKAKDKLYMTNDNKDQNVVITDAARYRSSSLKSSNFTFKVSNIKLVNGVYRATVTINYLDDYGVKPYYSSKIGRDVYFVPLKFKVTYADKYDCVRDLEMNKGNYDNYYMTNPSYKTDWVHRTVEYKWSTDKNLKGWDYTGEYRDVSK